MFDSTGIPHHCISSATGPKATERSCPMLIILRATYLGNTPPKPLSNVHSLRMVAISFQCWSALLRVEERAVCAFSSKTHFKWSTPLSCYMQICRQEAPWETCLAPCSLAVSGLSTWYTVTWMAFNALASLMWPLTLLLSQKVEFW